VQFARYKCVCALWLDSSVGLDLGTWSGSDITSARGDNVRRFLERGGKTKKPKFGNSLKLPPINTAFDALFAPSSPDFQKVNT
jgi:hypothetical protein